MQASHLCAWMPLEGFQPHEATVPAPAGVPARHGHQRAPARGRGCEPSGARDGRGPGWLGGSIVASGVGLPPAPSARGALLLGAPCGPTGSTLPRVHLTVLGVQSEPQERLFYGPGLYVTSPRRPLWPLSSAQALCRTPAPHPRDSALSPRC